MCGAESKAGAAAVEDDEDDDLIDFKAQLKARKKKRRRKRKRRTPSLRRCRGGKAAAIERAEKYATELLGRCFELLQERNPQLNVKKPRNCATKAAACRHAQDEL